VTEAARELAMSRFRLIQPYLEERRSLQLVAADANLSFRTAQRWVSQYRKLGLAAFVRKAREDRGARRVVSAKIKAAIEGLALERPGLPRPNNPKYRHIDWAGFSITAVHDRMTMPSGRSRVHRPRKCSCRRRSVRSAGVHL
jgi:hypothetical protein